MDQRGRPELRVRAARGAARGGLRRRELLRDVPHPVRPPTIVHVCDDLACQVNGAGSLIEEVESAIGPEGTDSDGATWSAARASGCASRRPAVLAQRAGAPRRVARRRDARDRSRGRGTGRQTSPAPARTPHRRHGTREPREPPAARARRAGRPDVDRRLPCAAAATRRSARAVELGPDATIRRGRRRRSSSAAAARRSPRGRSGRRSPSKPVRPHYVVCNADESEPGTFKDRLVMELIRSRCSRRSRSRGSRPAPSAATCTSAASTRSRASGSSTRSPSRDVAGCSATTSVGTASGSTSSSAAGRARTSAARRPRCSNRSRASAVSRGTSRRSR